MYRQAFGLLVGLCLGMSAARPQDVSPALTVDQLVEAALTRNREFLVAQQRVHEAEGLLTQARVGIADNLQVIGAAGQAFGKIGDDDLTATYSHTFETFGKRSRRVAVARKEIALARAEVEERRRNLVFDVKARYADAAAEQLKLAVIDRLSKVNQDYLRLIEARVEKGDAAPLEADLLRVELNRDRSRRALTEGRAQSAFLHLKAALDRPLNGSRLISPSLSVPSFSDDLPFLRSLARERRPDLRIVQLAVEQAQEQVALAKVQTKPNLTLSGQYSHSDTAYDPFGLTPGGALVPIRDHVDALGLGVSIPLTRGRRNRGNIEAAAAGQTGAQLRSDYLANVVPAQVEGAYQRWKSAQKAAGIFTQGVIQQSEKNVAVIRQAYNLGELRLIDVLNEQRRLLDTELSYIDTQADMFRAYAELEKAVGGSLQ